MTIVWNHGNLPFVKHTRVCFSYTVLIYIVSVLFLCRLPDAFQQETTDDAAEKKICISRTLVTFNQTHCFYTIWQHIIFYRNYWKLSVLERFGKGLVWFHTIIKPYQICLTKTQTFYTFLQHFSYVFYTHFIGCCVTRVKTYTKSPSFKPACLRQTISLLT